MKDGTVYGYYEKLTRGKGGKMGLEADLLVTIKNFNNIYFNNHRDYNVFNVMEITDKEVLVCRVLTDLLNPLGEHNNRSKYLRAFFEDVLKLKNVSDKELNQIHVYKEYLIEENRRIDIVIQSRKYFIPIEVKINAEEQESQCYDYYKYALQRDKNAKVIYLTKTGTYPSEKSTRCKNDKIAEPLSKEKILCISFEKHIRLWLEKILETESGIMKQMIRQYLEAINKFTGFPDEELRMEITHEILKDEATFRTGLSIASSINFVKAKLMKAVMQTYFCEIHYRSRLVLTL